CTMAGVFLFQAEDGIRGRNVTGVQTCALPISGVHGTAPPATSAPTEEDAPIATGRSGRPWCRGGRTEGAQSTSSWSGVKISSMEIGRASCRERVEIAVVAVLAEKKRREA